MVKEEKTSVLNGLSIGQGEAMSVEIKPDPDLKSEPAVESPSEAAATPETEDAKPYSTRKKSSSTSPPLEAGSSSASKKSSPSPTPAANSRKPTKSAPQLIGHLPIAREEALKTFTEIQFNNYQNKSLGKSKEMFESMTCDCVYEHGVDNEDDACGPFSDCINRLTQVECLPDDCRCRSHCQNQRFQKQQYANIDIVLTELKGYGLRAEDFIPKDSFIYEYVGDVVKPSAFTKRMREYALEGIQHFYFMMLQKDEFIDATKSGGIGRFANHSCSPNCYVAKWTVGDQVRMGIFSKRDIQKHEELTFNYNVDRYGHQAQTCYCGEPNCVGYIGGKTQTDIATMDDLYLDALGITDEEDVAALKGTKKKKGKKIDDPDFMITEDQAALRQIMRLRGYSVMKNVLDDHSEDADLMEMVLQCLDTWPLMNRNKVDDSTIDASVEKVMTLHGERESLKTLAQKLLDHWRGLPTYTRIPKRAIQSGETPSTATQVNDVQQQREVAQRRKQMLDELYERRKQELREQAMMQQNDFRAPKRMRFDEQQNQQPEKPAPPPIDSSAGHKESLKSIIANVEARLETEKKMAAAKAEAEAKAAAEKAARIEKKKARAAKKAAEKKMSEEQKAAMKDKRLLKLVGAVVVKCMSKYAKGLSRDQFKKYAKELTQIIADKEKKSSSFKDSRLESLSEEKQAKIKKFSKEYIAKVNRKIEAKNAQRPSASLTPTNATASSSTHTPRSADDQDGDVSMANGTGDMSMTVEEAMGMDPDSGSDNDGDDDADGDEDDEAAGAPGGDSTAPGPSTIPDSWNDINRLPPPSADEPMDVWQHEQWVEPGWESTDPRRREDLHLGY
ncbi:hypothetical protein H1R20_g2333, partial [Candolleomyces eurysporus]